MKRVLVGSLVAAAVSTGGSAFANEDTGAWYVTPMAQYSLLDDKRAAQDGFGFDVAVGKNFTEHVAGEFNYSNGSFRIHHQASDKLDAFTLDTLIKFLPASSVDPYFLIGGGELNDQIGRGLPTNRTFTAEAGVGAMTSIGAQTGSFRMQLRTEAKYRREFIQNTAYNPNNPGDVIFGVGLQFEFGAPTPPPPPAVEATPPPPPQPPQPLPPPPPLDSDQDGVPDNLDQCPHTPPGDKVDSVGCTIKDEIKLPGITFASDSAELLPESTQILNYAIATLKKYPEMSVEVQGYTDSRGSVQHNLSLSQRRAESVASYLREHGVANHMTAHGYGEDNPVDDNRTATGRLANRRVSMRIDGPP
jgi:OOP family OmpA-OmpF porin